MKGSQNWDLLPKTGDLLDETVKNPCRLLRMLPVVFGMLSWAVFPFSRVVINTRYLVVGLLVHVPSSEDIAMFH